LKYFVYKRVQQVKFVDRTFNFNEKRSLDIMRFIVESDNGVTNYHLEMCGELLTPAHYALLASARPGLFRFEIGVQSTNPQTLEAIRRRGDINLISEAVAKIHDIGGIELHLDLIAGLPYEDYQLFRKSFNDVYALGADTLQVGFLKLLKGTPLRDDAARYGYIFRQKAPYEVITNSYISADGLVRIKMIEEMVSLYHNRGGFGGVLDYVLRKGNAFDFYEAFALWYYDQGYQQRNHRKEDLYRILRAFLKVWMPAASGETMDQMLISDLAHATNADVAQRFESEGWTLPVRGKQGAIR